jgi:hypothetical protein
LRSVILFESLVSPDFAILVPLPFPFLRPVAVVALEVWERNSELAIAKVIRVGIYVRYRLSDVLPYDYGAI